MKKLKDILDRVTIRVLHGLDTVRIQSLVFDSRKVQAGDVFFAQKGVHVDGHLFIEKALDLGASVIVCETLPSVLKDAVTYVQVLDVSSALATMAANYYGNPSEKLQLIGITGTNGKTTVATLLYQLFTKAGYKTGLLSTVKVLVGATEHAATHTTPDSVAINHYLNTMVSSGVTHCFMEVSSHGIHQKRTEGLLFKGGVYTNLSHDHLDYHDTFLAYRDVKKSFFDALPKTAFALVNADDKNGLVMLQNTVAKKQTYALKKVADFKLKILEKSMSGTLLMVNSIEVWTKLIGVFNVYNLAAIIGTATLLGLERLEVLRLLSELESVSGRFQYFVSKKGVTAIVDYAHTPDALKNVLQTINDIVTGNEKIITVVGCGGDRDTTKRPKMAHIASQLSAQAIFTSDNPRSENPQTIIEDMEAGVLEENAAKTLSILDRKQAIKTACTLSAAGDIVLVAGKGHEKTQEINGERFHFDDFEVLSTCFNQ